MQHKTSGSRLSTTYTHKRINKLDILNHIKIKALSYLERKRLALFIRGLINFLFPIGSLSHQLKNYIHNDNHTTQGVGATHHHYYYKKYTRRRESKY